MYSAEVVPYRQNALFGAIAPELLETLRLEPAVRNFAAGEIIFEEGSKGGECYLVEKGLVRISKTTSGGNHETLGFIGPGRFFGELALYTDAPRSGRATATTATRTCVIARPEFERIQRIVPLELTQAIAQAGIEHLRQVNGNLADYLGDSDKFREIGAAIGMIAHDTRSPLATIRNAAELLEELLLEEHTDREQLLRFVRMIDRTSAHALESLDALLAEIRGEAPRVEEKVAVAELIDDVCNELQGVLRARPVTFDTRVEYDGELVCERRELVRSLVNLLRNAVEALPSDGGTVRLHVGREGDCVAFSIADTGCGIPIEQQGRIFERRFTRGKTGGTGLGLSQVRSAVERHGGTIDVDSRVGVGTTFSVRIPLEPRVTPPSTARE
ncbi:MAG TPA: ATP-binding protein [Longimicrobiales bacterium]|nr:ATP-binding protein [Longimicrobiales bacterium]